MPVEDFRIELPFGPPPILPDFRKELEEYLTKPHKLPIHNRKNDFKFWKRKINLDSLYHTDVSPVTTSLKVERNLDTGELLNFYELPIEGIGQTAKNSLSFSRAPGKATDDVRGTRTNYPFWPGGFDSPSLHQLSEENFDIDFEHDLLTKAPGLSREFQFTDDEGKSSTSKTEIDVIDFRNIMEDASNFHLWTDEPTEKNQKPKTERDLDAFEESVIPGEVQLPVLKISSSKSNRFAVKTEWAELLDTSKPVVDFHKKIEDPAVRWDFELDTFQKLAILKLEQHQHIFVSAHTSAGKTVVAEYAIGMSQKHCTKAIYTSPIKALSNQKYRDFKNRFEEVGLITGDYQVNQQASCLIMTTEILRSMLYAGSDVIRDLEFVIFDEVHYINDSERGHVWEEILIMLPDTVCIVMLSATVPNQLEFADWVGQIKRTKMYVVSTLKRPVPLQHYLYTGGSSSKKEENLFLIKDGDGPFLMPEYTKAVESKAKKNAAVKTKGDKDNKSKMIKTPAPRIMKSEKTYWEAFARFLQKYEKLPVVAFTLSRSKCDRNAEFLMSIDFTTNEEKNYIKYSFNQSIKTLKKEDQDLPQIKKMGFLLSQGIGVHHSGILPILKEIVEILFQKGLVKFLFATETFAMGVNMPARTVAFDSICKFDGTGTRDLQPAEYIQMAGRAGRRGQDATGTVIILCKNEVDKAANLRAMMLGDPTKLESQFKITYSMVLNLMRVKGMRVEEIMSHSFKEQRNRQKMDTYRKELKELEEEQNDDEEDITELPFYEEFNSFFRDALSFNDDWNENSGTILLHPKIKQELTVGKFMVITYQHYVNRLALILQVIPKPDSLRFKVLILCDAAELELTDKESDLFYQMVSLSKNNVFLPSAKPSHLVVVIDSKDIKHITKFSIKIDHNLVIKDWEQRQIPRFKDAPPSATFLRAVTELLEKSQTLSTSEDINSNFIRITDFRIADFELHEIIYNLESKRFHLDSYVMKEDISDFETVFKKIFKVRQKEAKKEKLKHLLSEKGLLSYQEYKQKVAVLKELKYINDEDIVEMKGKVACEMGSNELIITELIFEGTLSKFDPPEIAALLSCLVFQGKLEETDAELSDKLKEGIQAIETVRRKIVITEREYCGGSQEPNEMERLNFGLVRVVHEWAHGKAFAEIMELTEGQVQEGIIVRCIQQLNEILRDIKDAAKLFGDLVLKKKMEEASEAIKRDIVFAASLYTQD
ncbi:superkiller complex protein 2 [Planococcus citri]|uniref:superkiller complex protein 2 n=1 Tax=Planococcus citri TaxID=170843 RepID=UPI0031F86E68